MRAGARRTVAQAAGTAPVAWLHRGPTRHCPRQRTVPTSSSGAQDPAAHGHRGHRELRLPPAQHQSPPRLLSLPVLLPAPPRQMWGRSGTRCCSQQRCCAGVPCSPRSPRGHAGPFPLADGASAGPTPAQSRRRVARGRPAVGVGGSSAEEPGAALPPERLCHQELEGVGPAGQPGLRALSPAVPSSPRRLLCFDPMELHFQSHNLIKAA